MLVISASWVKNDIFSIYQDLSAELLPSVSTDLLSACVLCVPLACGGSVVLELLKKKKN